MRHIEVYKSLLNAIRVLKNVTLSIKDQFIYRYNSLTLFLGLFIFNIDIVRLARQRFNKIYNNIIYTYIIKNIRYICILNRDLIYSVE